MSACCMPVCGRTVGWELFSIWMMIGAPEAPIRAVDPADGTCTMVMKLSFQLWTKLERPRIRDEDRVGDGGHDVKAMLDRSRVHILVEAQDDRRAPYHGMIAVGDAGIDRQRRGQRPQGQPSRHENENDGENPPAAP